MKIYNVVKHTDSSGVRHILDFQLPSAKDATHFEASCLLGVRNIWRPADLYAKGSHLYLDTPSEIMTERIGKLLYNTILAN